jgi:hypothetical protein
VGLGPQVVDHRLAEPGADPAAARVRAGRGDEVVQCAGHAAADRAVVPVRGFAAAVVLDGEPAVAERHRAGERHRSRHAGGSEVGLHACDRRQAPERHQGDAVHLGDDRSTVGQVESDDDPHPGLVEPGGDDRHGKGGGNGPGERFGYRHGIVRPEDRLHHPRQPPRVRVRDQPCQRHAPASSGCR